MTKRNTLWMRYVEFSKLTAILQIIAKYNGQLNVSTLEGKVRQHQIFLDKNGQPKVGHSTLYHYRKVLEHLPLAILKSDGRYYIADDDTTRLFVSLTKESPQVLTEPAKECLRVKLVENVDCRRNFFDLFMQMPDYNLTTLRKSGSTAKVYFTNKYIETKRMPNKKVREIIISSEIGKSLHLTSFDEIQGIFWGLRLWSLDLGITNEIYTSNDSKRLIYPVAEHVNFDELLNDFIEQGDFKMGSSWSEIYIPQFIETVSVKRRVPVRRLHDFIIRLIEENEATVSFIPITMNAMMATSPYAGMDKTFLQYFPYIKGVGHISHLRVENNKIEEIKDE